MRRAGRGRDSGAAAVFFAVTAAGWVVLLSLIIIGGGKVRAHQRAYNIAAEAARAGGQAIDANSAFLGVNPKRIDPAKARIAATNYMTAAGATGTVAIVNGTTLVVTANIAYANPTGLPFPGERTWTATGTATATLLVR